MPPKRKAAAKFSSTPAKVSRKEQKEKDTREQTVSNLKQVKETIKHTVDTKFSPSCDIPLWKVHKDYDCMLNQTNIDANNNKFYLIQLLEHLHQPNHFLVWTRWGRVGESGQYASLGPFSVVNDAVKAFEKKFTDKTKNSWSKRNKFVFHPGKYSMVEVLEAESQEVVVPTGVNEADTAPSKLESHTLQLIQRIFNTQMFVHVMSTLNIDVKKMPLGKLSARQIASAFEVLSELEDVLKGHKPGDVNFLSSRFYTLMPHSFGRNRPPPISTLDLLQEKMNNLNILSDVALAQKMQEDQPAAKNKNVLPNPWDEKYALLECDIEWLDEKHNERKLLAQFFENTKSSYGILVNVWKIRRSQEPERLKQHAKVPNHKLLWHGTSVGVIAAILKTGLRIMPHSGGLVGKGIYFASQADKSMGYCGSDQDGHRLMFITEVVLGKEHYIYRPDGSITKPPPGYQSVVAFGRVDSNPEESKSLTIDGLEITVPYSRPVNRSSKNTNFHHSEYLIYDESQACLRYLVEWKS